MPMSTLTPLERLLLRFSGVCLAIIMASVTFVIVVAAYHVATGG